MHMPQEGLFSRACYLAGEFAQRQLEAGKPTGLLLAFGYRPDLETYTGRMGEPLLNGHTGTSLIDLPQAEIYGVFADMAEMDGAISIDLDGRLVAAPTELRPPAGVEVNPSTERAVEEIKRPYVGRPQMGSRHRSAARWSELGTWNFAIAVSGDAGTVIPFVRGKVVPEYVWEPNAPAHVVHSPPLLPHYPAAEGDGQPAPSVGWAAFRTWVGENFRSPGELLPDAYADILGK